MGNKVRKPKPKPKPTMAMITVRPTPWSRGHIEGWPKDAAGNYRWVTLYAEGGWTTIASAACEIPLEHAGEVAGFFAEEAREDEGAEVVYQIGINPCPPNDPPEDTP